jgi:hypothetical protein
MQVEHTFTVASDMILVRGRPKHKGEAITESDCGSLLGVLLSTGAVVASPSIEEDEETSIPFPEVEEDQPWVGGGLYAIGSIVRPKVDLQPSPDTEPVIKAGTLGKVYGFDSEDGETVKLSIHFRTEEGSQVFSTAFEITATKEKIEELIELAPELEPATALKLPANPPKKGPKPKTTKPRAPKPPKVK